MDNICDFDRTVARGRLRFTSAKTDLHIFLSQTWERKGHPTLQRNATSEKAKTPIRAQSYFEVSIDKDSECMTTDNINRRHIQFHHDEVNFRLQQKYGLLESLRVRFPKLGKLMVLFGFGKHRCLICETAESKKQKLWRCSNKRCRMMYCNICWLEIEVSCRKLNRKSGSIGLIE